MLFNFRYFVLCHPTPLRSQAFVAMQSIMFAGVSVGQEKLACAIGVEMQHLEKSYLTLCWLLSDIFFFCHPTPLRSQAFVAMQSIIPAFVSVGQEKFSCAIRAETKHLERSYSILCCSISDIWSFFTPPPCVDRHLWQCYPLCLRWGLWVRRRLHV